MKLSLQNRDIPRNKAGDPAFTEGVGTRLYDVFTPAEVHELVNRCLYQLEYQSRAHLKRREQEAALDKPIKEVFRQLYPHESWMKATDEQLRACILVVKKQQQDKP